MEKKLLRPIAAKQELEATINSMVDDTIDKHNKSDICCLKLDLLLKSSDTIIYLPATRTCLLKITDEMTYTLSYCPCCDKLLPKDLTDELTYIIYEELSLDGYDDHRLPKQFKSDEWWKSIKSSAEI